jgi:hypothetical protein
LFDPSFFQQLVQYALIGVLIGLAFYVYVSICISAIARKTGTPGAWMAWIPIANMLLLCRVAKRPGSWLLLLLIPILNLAVLLVILRDVARIRGKNPNLPFLLLIPPVGMLLVPGLLAAGPAGSDSPPQTSIPHATPRAKHAPVTPAVCPACGRTECVGDVFCGYTGQPIAGIGPAMAGATQTSAAPPAPEQAGLLVKALAALVVLIVVSLMGYGLYSRLVNASGGTASSPATASTASSPVTTLGTGASASVSDAASGVVGPQAAAVDSSRPPLVIPEQPVAVAPQRLPSRNSPVPVRQLEPATPVETRPDKTAALRELDDQRKAFEDLKGKQDQQQRELADVRRQLTEEQEKREREERMREQEGARLVSAQQIQEPKPPQASAYAGPNSGVLIWDGTVHGTELITIENDRASSGTLTGALPGVLVLIQPAEPKKVAIASAPAPTNQFRRLVFRVSGNGPTRVTLRWSLP